MSRRLYFQNGTSLQDLHLSTRVRTWAHQMYFSLRRPALQNESTSEKITLGSPMDNGYSCFFKPVTAYCNSLSNHQTNTWKYLSDCEDSEMAKIYFLGPLNLILLSYKTLVKREQSYRSTHVVLALHTDLKCKMYSFCFVFDKYLSLKKYTII